MIEWLPIPEALRYELSSDGQVRHGDKLLRVQFSEKGYTRITLWCDDGVKRTFRINVLVARLFIGPRPDGMEVCHENGVHSDNRHENLRYDTPTNNQLDSVRHGTHNHASKIRCKRGHLFAGANLMPSARLGHRHCRSCNAGRSAHGQYGQDIDTVADAFYTKLGVE